MSYHKEPPIEHDSAYFMQDRENAEEITRLSLQDEMLTTAMGGVFPELADPTSLRRVLDVGCGTGGWLMDVAKAYPTIERLIGADVNSNVLSHARVRARIRGLDGHVEFQAMDALRRLEFPASYFDLVNQRAGMSWLRTWEWKKALLEYHRVTRAGGIIRITECNVLVESSSPALTKLFEIALAACRNSGRLFTPEVDGVTSELVDIMTQLTIENVQCRVYPLVFRAGTPGGLHFYRDILIGFRVAMPFFQKWTRVPDNYLEIYRQALTEIQQPDFLAAWTWVTAWGTKSLYGEPLLIRGLK
jgi:ubiquinone/menaquinone biosynthesis C-methylase UbiE